jgi:uncharacterized protein
MNPDRRLVLQAGAAGLVSLLAPGCATTTRPALGFTPVPPSLDDRLVVPPGYEAQVLYRWGEPTGIAGSTPAWRPDASNSAQEQAAQAGMHHDGMHFFALSDDGRRGLLVLNHEYTDEGLLHTDGVTVWTAEKVRKSQHAVGVSVIEVAFNGQQWKQVLPSSYARRIHANTPMRIAGPAAGTPLLRTALDPTGTQVFGTYANCAMGVTPWGTYLTCEENFDGYFGGGSNTPVTPLQKRYGISPGQPWVEWWRFDERFDASRHANEANRFGWVVEIDPFDPTSTPIKRTALGRKKQESATCTLTRDGRVAVYMGDDQRFEYIYKFVSRDKVRPGGLAANREVLDHGTLYVARFDTGGRGQWLELTQGHGGLDAARGFATQADVVVNARGAADVVGATPMDRPEWIAIHPHTGEVFASLSNNTQRGAPGRPGPDAANPRANNAGGQVIQWREAAGDAAATAFDWKLFALGNQPSKDSDDFAAPDGLHFDAGGLLWIQTDMSSQAIGQGAYAALGNNGMFCADVGTGRIQRFLSAPRGAEVTGCVVTPDRRTLFVNIQHPGEASDSGGTPTSTWPDGSGRPRSATVAIRRRDGGVVGS